MSDYEVLSGRHNWISFPGNQLVGETQDQCQWPIIWITRVKGGRGEERGWKVIHKLTLGMNRLKNLSNKFNLTDQINIMFGLFDVDNHFMLLNHIMLIAKQTIFLCRQKSITPSFIIFLAHLKKIFRIEEYLAKEKKKLNLHLMKWEKLLQSLSWNNFTLGSLVLIFLFIYLFIYWPYTILFTLYCCNFFLT